MRFEVWNARIGDGRPDWWRWSFEYSEEGGKEIVIGNIMDYLQDGNLSEIIRMVPSSFFYSNLFLFCIVG